MKKNKIKKIAVFLDGSPGHEKQTLGIVGQLVKKMDVEILHCQVKKSSLINQFVTLLCYFLAVPFKSDGKFADADLAIGTGTHTHLPMLRAKQAFNLKVVTCMTPASYLLNRFDLAFVPIHDDVTPKDNIITTIGPPGTNINKRQHQKNRVLVLIGGADPNSHLWESVKIVNSIESLISPDNDKEFILSSSPRTPSETEELLVQTIQKYNNCKFYRFEETPAGWVEKEYSRCSNVWVTGDSISMVYEALSSGCQVGIIPVIWKSSTSKFSRSERYLREKQLTVELESYLNGKAIWRNADSLNEAERCAEEILRRWG